MTTPSAQFVYSYAVLLGHIVTVHTTQNQKYEGVLHAVNVAGKGGFGVMLKSARLVDSEDKRLFPAVVIAGKDFAYMEAKNVAVETAANKHKKTGFQTDTAISGHKGIAERELEKWTPGADHGGSDLMGLEDDHSSARWDQFAVNESKFGLTTDYDEEFYTTKLDRQSETYRKREKDAVRIAREIESATTSNVHMLEERGGVIDDNDVDEEDRYGAVVRKTPTNKWVPPSQQKRRLQEFQQQVALANSTGSNNNNNISNNGASANTPTSTQPVTPSPLAREITSPAQSPVKKAAAASDTNGKSADGKSSRQKFDYQPTALPENISMKALITEINQMPNLMKLDRILLSASSSRHSVLGGHGHSSITSSQAAAAMHHLTAQKMQKNATISAHGSLSTGPKRPPLAGALDRKNLEPILPKKMGDFLAKEKQRAAAKKEKLRQESIESLKSFHQQFKLKSNCPTDIRELFHSKDSLTESPSPTDAVDVKTPSAPAASTSSPKPNVAAASTKSTASVNPPSAKQTAPATTASPPPPAAVPAGAKAKPAVKEINTKPAPSAQPAPGPVNGATRTSPAPPSAGSAKSDTRSNSANTTTNNGKSVTPSEKSAANDSKKFSFNLDAPAFVPGGGGFTVPTAVQSPTQATASAKAAPPINGTSRSSSASSNPPSHVHQQPVVKNNANRAPSSTGGSRPSSFIAQPVKMGSAFFAGKEISKEPISLNEVFQAGFKNGSGKAASVAPTWPVNTNGAPGRSFRNAFPFAPQMAADATFYHQQAYAPYYYNQPAAFGRMAPQGMMAPPPGAYPAPMGPVAAVAAVPYTAVAPPGVAGPAMIAAAQFAMPAQVALPPHYQQRPPAHVQYYHAQAAPQQVPASSQPPTTSPQTSQQPSQAQQSPAPQQQQQQQQLAQWQSGGRPPSIMVPHHDGMMPANAQLIAIPPHMAAPHPHAHPHPHHLPMGAAMYPIAMQPQPGQPPHALGGIPVQPAMGEVSSGVGE
ncbi:poly(A)-binding protein binding protein [Sorochytrium milnesiophthora]